MVGEIPHNYLNRSEVECTNLYSKSPWTYDSKIPFSHSILFKNALTVNA